MLWLIVFCALCVTTARTQVVETPTVYDFLGQGRFLNDKPSVPMGVFAGLVDRQLPIRVFECDWGNAVEKVGSARVFLPQPSKGEKSSANQMSR